MSSIRAELERYGFLLPDFGNSNLSVLKEIRKGSGRHIGRRKKMVFLLVDGLGYETVVKISKHSDAIRKLIDRSSLEKGSTIFPSFTPSVIISLNSGMSVSGHGIIGDVFSKELGTIINPFSRPWFPNEEEVEGKAPRIIPNPDLLSDIDKKYRMLYLQVDSICRKEKDTPFFKKLKVMEHSGNEDLFVHIKREVKKSDFGFLYAYTNMIDHFSHAYSKNSEETERLAMRIFNDIMYVEKDLVDSGYELVLTADHGQIVYRNKDVNTIRWNDKFASFLDMPAFGNGRSLFLRVADKKLKQFEDYFEKNYAEKAVLFDTDEILKSGILGNDKPSDFARFSFGNKVMIARGNNVFRYFSYGREWKNPENIIRGEFEGTHGGMSPEEMEVPIMVIGN